MLPRLQAIPGVTHVAIGSDLPGLGAATQQIEIEHSTVDNPAHRPSVSFVVQSPGYLDAIHLPILLGRDFNETDGTPQHKAAILTRECAEHFWPNQIRIGKRFRLYDDKNKPAIGSPSSVSRPTSFSSSTRDPRPLLFVPSRQEGLERHGRAGRSSSNPTSAVRAAVQNLDSELPLRDVYMLTAAVEHQQWYLHLFSKLFSRFRVDCAAHGFGGHLRRHCAGDSSRTQEIGVRMALGANARNIVTLIMTRGLWQIVAGLALGLGAAIPATHLMASLPLSVSPSDPIVLLHVSLVAGVVGLFACWLPARRAAALDPVKAIRYE